MRRLGPIALLAISLFVTGVKADLKIPPLNGPPLPPPATPPQVPKDGAGLIAFFKHRTPSAADTQRITAAIRRLGDDNFKVRKEAMVALVRCGVVALPFLRKAQDNDDAEIAARAGEIIGQIEKENDPARVTAAAQAVARLKPTGAVEPLLAYLPYTRDNATEDAVQSALKALAVRNGKPEPSLLRALADPSPARRAAAGEALVVGGPAAVRKDVARLLQDADLQVRLKVANAFVAVKDKAGVPVLIDLMGLLPREQLWRIEETLMHLAGNKAPRLTLGDNAPAKVRGAWAAWWRDHRDKIDLARLDQPSALLGYTLLVLRGSPRSFAGAVTEIAKDGTTRWQISDLDYPMDAQVIGNDRVLIAEYRGQKVTERDLKGKVLWQKAVDMPTGCQRLANGNTFIVSRLLLVEVDRKGREVFSYRPPNYLVVAARKMRNGQIAVVATDGSYRRLDARGKEVKSFPVGRLYTVGVSFDVLPSGHVVVPDYRGNRVVEFDGDGKMVWQAEARRPTSVMRLPNGNTLVASRAPREVMEIDRKGKEVWRHAVKGYLIKASRR